ncbi:MAG TPA: porin, partial [Kofleriaceae bacterium]|nr:porin [Kofleriaceae bacterium]
TGMFEADNSTILGAEAYYLNGPFSAGSEYFINQVRSDTTGDPFFHGGEVFAAYLFTGESHPYNARGAYFEDVVPERSFFRNGHGAVELVGRVSYVDLDSAAVRGGRFLRATALLNWYLSEALRFEAAYGIGFLDRDDLVGRTQFFMTRIQLSIE